MPAVVTILAVEVQQVCAVEIFGIDAVVRPLFQLSAILNHSAFLIDVSSLRYHQPSASFGGVLREDIDDSVHGLHSPNGPSRTSNHYDPGNVHKGKIRNVVPENARGQGGIHGAPVDHHQQ